MKKDIDLFVCLMVFNATFNTISVISWRSVLLVKETGGPVENHRHVASHWQSLSHNGVHVRYWCIYFNCIAYAYIWLELYKMFILIIVLLHKSDNSYNS